MTDTAKKTIAVFGATSLVGTLLLQQLLQKDYQVIALSRNNPDTKQCLEGVTWVNVTNLSKYQENIEYCISVAPIWAMSSYFDDLESLKIKTIVAVSSTSVFSKQDSNNPKEQAIASKLQLGEESLIDWAIQNNINWTILRPTLIYGYQRDKNVTEITRFIQRFGFFPLFGKANGLRQPIHADDVANACRKALLTNSANNKSYQITGGETLSYREMVARVFQSQGKKIRFVQIPLGLFRLVLSILKLLPRFRQWSPQMVERMNKDLVFEDSLARKDFGFSPQNFDP